ncbi:MAG: hypothetical protein ONB46_11425 [candidate division KSB1 bacterium]|nr:hypothetical protein [candidate division KSB1 bacterium]MDZ7366301.1 hypothetical protein [candidate division KSB1 bacterium]MDZ7403957.1 hypothetical protein [candidate division KSB1 bacterium]
MQRIRQEVQKEVQAQALQESIMTALEAHFDGVNGKIARISLNTVVNALQKAKPTAKRNAAKA